MSLIEGVFANKWKIAIIKPLVKKIGLDLITKCYRPVSNLSFMYKLVERCMLTQFNRHCEDNQLMSVYQSAYRSNHSGKTSLVKQVNDILWKTKCGSISSTGSQCCLWHSWPWGTFGCVINQIWHFWKCTQLVQLVLKTKELSGWNWGLKVIWKAIRIPCPTRQLCGSSDILRSMLAHYKQTP